MGNNNQFQKDKKTLFAMMGAAWILCIVLIASLAVPFTLRIYKTKDELDESRLELEAIKYDLANSDKYRSLRESISESKDLLEQAVLKESTVINFIQSLENTAKDTGNTIEIAPYTPPKKSKKSEPANEENNAAQDQKADEAKAGQYFQLTVTGNYPQLLNFLAKLENLGYVFSISSIEVKTKVGANNFSLQDEARETGGNIESKIIISFSLQK